MATLRQVEEHRRAVFDLTTVAMAELVRVWRSLTLDDAAEATRQIKALLPLLIDGYGPAMGALSADWYDDLREAAEVRGRYVARVGDLPADGQVTALAGWAVSPLWQANPAPDLALSKLSGGVQRLLADIDRDTTTSNAEADPGKPTWARHASANACAFCAMLATRDGVYLSEAAATGVVGRGANKRHDGSRNDNLRKGIRARGKRALGEKYHDHCHCTAVPVWPGQTLERAPYVDEWEQAYIAASRETGETKGLLAHMRESLGTH